MFGFFVSMFFLLILFGFCSLLLWLAIGTDGYKDGDD